MSNGTAGNRTGYKVFSFNTTIRNPKRNRDFLTIFEPFNGQVFDKDCAYRYLYELIKHGVYQVSDISTEIRNKWENDIALSPEEIHRAIDDNPQACGYKGRVMTQLRAIKDQGFLMFKKVKKNNIITLTKLGWDIIHNVKDPTVAYTKAMLGVHAKSPSRVTLLNKARPFLNTLFVIETVNAKWKALGNTPKGILMHEFAAFVLSMKDCDYEAAAQRIIDYRLRFRYEANKDYIESYLDSEHILSLKFDSLIIDYPDDVFRKFEMTGLLKRHGKSSYIYIDFSSYNYSKVQEILKAYRNYKWEEFSSVEDYYAYMENQTIPWEDNDFIRRKVVEEKAKVLGITLNTDSTLEQKEEMLDRLFYTHALEGAIKKYDYSFIGQELQILAKTRKAESKLETIPEPLRLEYLLALYFGKRYGLKGLISNIIYNEDGLPLHCAAGGKSDIIFHSNDGSYILEPTMITSKAQQLNNETSNIVRHVKDEESKTNLHYRVMMIAPRVHEDVARFFKFEAQEDEAKITPVTIERTLGLFQDSETLRELGINYDEILQLLLSNKVQVYTDTINAYRVQSKQTTDKTPEPPIEQTIIPLVYPEYKPGRIPLYTLRAACGYFGEGRLPEEEGWVDATGLGFTPDPKRYFAVHAKGDSMLPKIQDGDICIFEWYTGGSRDGEIVLSQISEFDDAYDGRYTIKRYHSTKKYDEYGNWEHASIQLQPLNPNFNPIDINEFDEVPVIGIFKCVLN